MACYLALRWGQAHVPPADRNSFFIVSREREANLRLTRTAWNSIGRLQAFGLIQRTDYTGRDPYSGTIESFRDKWQAGEVTPAPGTPSSTPACNVRLCRPCAMPWSIPWRRCGLTQRTR
ncbi:hypothetical protein ABZ777_12270 [Micromonospora parva]|uniref:hypothetical protein n=1 Tax=Micromonospora parva TaxID=1464048 RepID=UPI0033FB97F3